MMFRDFRKIKAWQLADDLVVAVYGVTKKYPRDEIYGLTSQLRRAAYSGPSNIAEGASRSSQKDYLHFLYIARGSIAEAGYFLHLSFRLGYLDADAYGQLESQAREVQACLLGLIKAVDKEAHP